MPPDDRLSKGSVNSFVQASMADLDIIIPVYNEGGSIREVLDSFQRSVKSRFRVLLCYDHDGDNTLLAVRAYQNAEFEIIPVKNRRSGAHGAIVTGFQASTAPAVLVMPADDTYNAGLIDLMVEQARQGCDIVAPSRFMKGGRMVGCPWLKAFFVRLSAFVLYHVARLPTYDASNGFRMFSRRVLDLIPIESSIGFTYSIELLVKCHRLGWRIEEMPALWFERKKGVSRFKVFKWLPGYLRWCGYAFVTTFLLRGPRTVKTMQFNGMMTS